MNLAHLHLVMNHVPTVGAVVALGLLLLAFIRRNEHLKHAGLEVLFVIAVLTLPVYVSGVAAYYEMRERPDISVDAIRIHQDAALIGFTVMEFAGFVALGRLVAVEASRPRGARGRPRGNGAARCGARHHGSRGESRWRYSPSRDPCGRRCRACRRRSGTIHDVSYQEVAVYSTWAWPAAEAVHFLGLSLSFGVLLAVNLRILGVMKTDSLCGRPSSAAMGHAGLRRQSHHRDVLLRRTARRSTSRVRRSTGRLIFLMIAGANFLYLTVFGKAWRHTEDGDAGFEASLADKAMAVSSIVAWLAVLYAGRMLPFLGKSF